MATTYMLISSQVLGSSASTVTFSSIPQSYTDLVLLYSGRVSPNANVEASINLRFNGDTASNYSSSLFSGNGSTTAFSLDSNQTNAYIFYGLTADNSTANTFGNGEIYIPNYTSSSNKSFSSFGVAETNATAARIGNTSLLWRNTAAITSISLTPFSGSFVTNSSFYLYGISKN